MNLKHILLGISLIVVASCGIIRSGSDSFSDESLVQDSFYGVRFKDPSRQVRNKMYKYRPVTGLLNNTIVFINMSFSGYEWPILEMRFTEDKLYDVVFNNRFDEEKPATNLYESLLTRLMIKYPNLEPLSNGEGYRYTDSKNNTVSLRIRYGTSRGGDTGWFCTLSYTNGEGSFLNTLKSIDEL